MEDTKELTSRQLAGKSYNEKKSVSTATAPPLLVCAFLGRARRAHHLVDLIAATIDFLRHIILLVRWL